jgi:hypothetical protein
VRPWRGEASDRRGYHHGNLKEALIEAAAQGPAEAGGEVGEAALGHLLQQRLAAAEMPVDYAAIFEARPAAAGTPPVPRDRDAFGLLVEALRAAGPARRAAGRPPRASRCRATATRPRGRRSAGRRPATAAEPRPSEISRAQP